MQSSDTLMFMLVVIKWIWKKLLTPLALRNQVYKYLMPSIKFKYILYQILNAWIIIGILQQLHGSFMIIAWLISGSIGIMLPRYMKKTWVGKQFMGKDIWFAVNKEKSYFFKN